ncbi:serine hydrolase domain-containing protein [Streptomyces sp. NPDC090445]|uniref:serine hydrolase domain-containing protein n=1 Tax=Streptomyces sp. NPDC090445 TaxID=3365963 RepID=UPI0038307BC3
MTKSSLSTNSPASHRRWIGLAAGCAALVSLTAGALPAAAADGAGPAPDAAAGAEVRVRLDEAALQGLMVPDKVASGTMARVSAPGVRWTGVTGGLSQDPAASFRIGSVTKLFTSTVVLQLVAEGRFTLDTPVQRILPGTLPAHWAPITVGQLLSHTSGLGRPCVAPENPQAPTPAAVVAAVTDPACPAPEYPVTRQQYNGINHFLAGMVIEKATGRSYADEVQRRIVRPLGLRHTYLPAAGDTSMPAPSLAAPSEVEPWAWAEGGMISNAPDLERFLGALLRGRLLPPAQQRELFAMPALAQGARDPMSRAGLLRAELPDGTVVWGKTGSMEPYTSGLFGTADGRRVLTYAYTGVTRDPEVQRTRALDLVAAAF